MITSDKLELYRKYSGNIENWDRFGKKKDRLLLEYEEWELIDELLSGLELIEKGLVSEGYQLRILEKVNESCDSDKTRQELKKFIGKYRWLKYLVIINL